MPGPRGRPVHLLILVIVVIAAARTIEKPPLAGLALLDSGSGSMPRATATPMPGTPLASATRHFLEGEYSKAEAALSPLIGNADPAIDAGARDLLARVLLADNRAQEASDVLADLVATHPGSEAAQRGHFFQAEAWDELGDHARAAEGFRAFAARNPDIAPYVRLRGATSLAQAGQLDEAQRELMAVADAPVPLRTTVHALEELRALQEEQGDRAGYLATTERLLKLATLPAYQAELTYQAASAQAELGQHDAARIGFEQVVTGSPASPYALPALRALQERDAAGSLLAEQVGLVYLYGGEYLAAIEAFSVALEANPASDLAWYHRALARFRNGDDIGAVAEWQEMATRFPASPLTPAGLAIAARSLEVDGLLDEARATYQVILDGFPASDEAPEARFRIGLIEYLRGDLAAATEAWQVANDSRAAFWLGKVQERAGDLVAARDWWRTAVDREPGDFYGLRARALLDGVDDATVPHAIDPRVVDPAANMTELDAWFETLGASGDEIRSSIEATIGYRRAMALLALGLSEEAGWEIDTLVVWAEGDPLRLAMLAELLYAQERPEIAYPIGLQAVDAAEARGMIVPDALVRLAYPIPFADMVTVTAREQGVDPLLFMALMQQESSFNRLARSPVGALGLTQVMPATGQELALNLGLSDWQPEDLHRPSVSIELGVAFLADQLQQFQGQIAPALAAYNAGGGAVSGWLDMPGVDDRDVFVERIPYPETYDYVQIVYANYLRYVGLYGD